jgi:hydroxymethylpyrimidine pyrophosphatase-like HAD family hydrolase
MKRKEEFKSFYNEGLKAALNSTEKDRLIVFVQLILCIVLPIIFIPILVMIYLNTKIEMVLLPALILLLGSPIYIYSLLGETIYYKSFKKKLIARIIKYVNPNLNYDNLRKVEDYEYFNADFFTNTNVINYGDDHVTGTINGVNVEFSEFLSKYIDKADQKAAGNEFQFRGLFFAVEFKHNFKANIILKTSGLPYSADEEDVEIGNEAFDKLFYVKVPKGKENIKQVLTPRIIEALLKVRDDCPNEFMVSFKDNNFYLAIVHEEDLFEPVIMKTVKNYERVFKHFENIFYPILLIEVVTKEFGNT